MNNQRYNGGDLKTGFIFAQLGGRDILSFSGNDVAQTGDRQFAPDNDTHDPGLSATGSITLPSVDTIPRRRA